MLSIVKSQAKTGRKVGGVIFDGLMWYSIEQKIQSNLESGTFELRNVYTWLFRCLKIGNFSQMNTPKANASLDTIGNKALLYQLALRTFRIYR